MGPPVNKVIRAFPDNIYRAKLGIGLSPEVKKTPRMTYRPGVGLVPIGCCEPPYVPPPIVFDGGSPAMSGPLVLDGGNPSGSGAIHYDGGNP